MTTLLQDLRYGARMLLKHPGFTFVAVAALALGIGANTAIFSVVNAVVLRPLPFANSERIVRIYGTNEKDAAERAPLSYPDFADYRSQSQSVEHVAAYSFASTSMRTGAGEPERLDGIIVSSDLFPLLDVKPIAGRVFTPEEDRKGVAPVVVLSYGLWRRSFNSDRGIIGREISLGNRSTTVVGVMPPDFKFPVDSERVSYWMPLAADPGAGEMIDKRGAHFMEALAKLKPALTIGQAEAEMNLIARRLEAQYPTDVDKGSRLHLVSLHEDLVGDVRPALFVLLGAVGFVLLIACANVANLSLARAAGRTREIAIRTALGASRARVIRQLLTESVLLSTAGGALGLLLAMWGVDLLTAASRGIPRLNEVALDGGVLAFTLSVSLATGIFFGLFPALATSKLDLTESLKEGGRSSSEGASRKRVRGLLVVSEVALALMLLVGAGLLIKSFAKLLQTDPGYDTERVLTLDVGLSRIKYPTPEQQTAFLQQVLHRVETLPGVEAVGATDLLPLSGSDSKTTFKIEGRSVGQGEEPNARSQSVSPNLFRAMSIPLREGRDFTERDAKTAAPVLIVNEAFARRFYPGEDALGKRVHLDSDEDDSPPREIVGVVGDVHHERLTADVYPGYYTPYLQHPGRRINLVVRSASTDPKALASAVRGAVKEVDKDQLIWETKTMSERLSASVASRRFRMMLLGIFAALALMLAAIGIYGVMSYAVTQRTHEIGIRMALGAQASDVFKLVVKHGMMLALVGIGAGLIGAFAVTRVMASLLYGVSATDPLIFFGVALLLASVAFLACYIPARRATKVDPMIALRYE